MSVKHLLLPILFVFAFLLMPSPAEAHFKEHDGNFNGLLHVDPGDKATAQQHVTLMMTITDQTHKFQINNCDCKVTISMPGKLPYTQQITTPSATTGGLYAVMVPFAFPRGGTYNISFIGKPIKPNSFEPFTITWDDFKVTPAVNEVQTLKTPKTTSGSNMIYVVLGALILIIASSYVYKKKFAKKASL